MCVCEPMDPKHRPGDLLSLSGTAAHNRPTTNTCCAYWLRPRSQHSSFLAAFLLTCSEQTGEGRRQLTCVFLSEGTIGARSESSSPRHKSKFKRRDDEDLDGKLSLASSDSVRRKRNKHIRELTIIFC